MKGLIMEIAFVLLFLYLLPTIAASLNNHPYCAAIFIANVFLGWSILGWILCLVWAFVKK